MSAGKRSLNSGNMSRLAKRPIALPQGVEVTVSADSFSIKGSKGVLMKPLHRDVSIEKTPEGIIVTAKRENLATKPLPGTYAAHVKNMIVGVTKGFEKRLIVEGVGFRWEIAGKTIKLSLGFSHPVEAHIPEGVTASVEKGVLVISGSDREVVGQFAAEIRALKKPEPYKGKGIRYEKEVIRRKQGKKTA